MIPLFSAQSKVTPVSVTTSASTPAALPNKGNTLRVINESTSGAYFCVASSSTNATLPSAGLTTSAWIGPNGDITLSIPDSDLQYVSAITRSGTATLAFYVGEGV